MKGYRRLKVGEIIKEGDKYTSEFCKELSHCSATIGNKYDGSGKFYRPLPQQKPKPSMWIEVFGYNSIKLWSYGIFRRNGKGVLNSKPYTSKSACVWMAKRTAKALGVEYRGVTK